MVLSRHAAILVGGFFIVAVYLVSLHSYLLFHGLAELFSIVILFGVFTVAWSARQWMGNGYLLFAGIACLFVGFLDLVHTLAYKGMGVFQEGSANIPTQLYIAARFLQATFLLIAPVFLGRKLNGKMALAAYAAVVALVLLSIFRWDLFPDAYVDGVGLTPFKKVSELAISLILLAAMAALRFKSKAFDSGVLRLLIAFLAFSIAGELSLTLYAGVFDFPNLLGHLLKIIASYLLYKAIVEAGILRPYKLLKHAEQSLTTSNRRLMEALEGLKQAQERTIAQERLRALGTMASGIAHDFNNTLTPILGFSEALLSQRGNLEKPEVVESHLRIIRDAASDAAKVVKRMREFYRPHDETDALFPLSLNTVAEQAVELTQPRWKDQAQEKGGALRVEKEFAQLPALFGDPAALREALTNLIFNAVDAMPNGGRIRLRTWVERGDAVLEVGDTGVGMSEEVKRRCMDPFFTTKGEHGTGLGLSMVYGIVRRHGGHVEIESAPGQGTAVRLRLPISSDETREVPPAVEAAPGPRTLHILVVDDEPLVREVLAGHLSGDGHEVETAACGQEGLDKLRSGHFDLVITDMAMGEMTGVQLATAAKRVNPRLPVILLTGFEALMEQVPEGVDLLLGKPVSLEELREAVERSATRPSPGG